MRCGGDKSPLRGSGQPAHQSWHSCGLHRGRRPADHPRRRRDPIALHGERTAEEELFNQAIEPELLRARNSLRRNSSPVVAFGEMVAMSWNQGKYEAARELERLWDLLAQRHAFSLRCAYPMEMISESADDQPFRQARSASPQVASESFTSLAKDHDPRCIISSPQQKAWTIQAVMQGREEEIKRLKLLELMLKRSEEFAKGVAECSVDCIKVLDLEGRVNYMSPAGMRALEIESLSEVEGRRWADFWSAEDRPRAEGAVTTAREGGVGCFNGEAVTPSGLRKWWDVRITPALNQQGSPERLIAISRDITEFRAAQQAAIQSERQASAGRMAATIAHEINNPLEAVTNFIYLALTTAGLPEDAARHLQVADRELARAAQITRQMLSFYRGGAKHKWVHVSELITDVLNIYGRKLRNKHLTPSMEVDPDLQVYGKDGELRQILLNLTANAVDASRAGGTLWFRAHRACHRKSGEGIRITVADNGSGISEDVKRRMFVPFFTTKNENGTGIGLWVTRCLVEQRGGFMQFRSRQGENAGTVMSFFLPIPRKSNDEVMEAAS